MDSALLGLGRRAARGPLGARHGAPRRARRPSAARIQGTSAATIAAQAWVKLEQARAAATERGARGLYISATESENTVHFYQVRRDAHEARSGAVRAGAEGHPLRVPCRINLRPTLQPAFSDLAHNRDFVGDDGVDAPRQDAFEPLVVVDPHVDTSATFVFSSRTSSAVAASRSARRSRRSRAAQQPAYPPHLPRPPDRKEQQDVRIVDE